MKNNTSCICRVLLVEPQVECIKRRNYASLGSLVVYNLIQNHPRFECDYIRFERKNIFKKTLIKYDFQKYHIIAFSILSPTSFFNIYPFFKMSKINPKNVFVIAGGAGILNPLPIAKVVDLIFLGYAEKPLKLFLNLWSSGEIKKGQIKTINGTFSLNANKEFTPYLSDIDVSLYRDYNKMRKYPELEIIRGCKGNCHFCQESRYKCILELPLSKIERLIKSFKIKGPIRISGPDVFDHSQIEKVFDFFAQSRIGYPFGVSLKPVKATDKVIKRLHQVGVKLFSIGIEGFSESLREKSGKPLSNEKLIHIILTCYETGLRNIRILIIMNLPGQHIVDIDEFLSVMKIISRSIKRKFNIKLSMTSFIPRPFTYFHNHIFKKDKIPCLNYQKKKLIEQLKGINTNDFVISFTKNTVLENDYLAQFIYFGLTDFDEILKDLCTEGFVFYGNNYSRQHSVISSNKKVINHVFDVYGIDENYILRAKNVLANEYGGNSGIRN